MIPDILPHVTSDNVPSRIAVQERVVLQATLQLASHQLYTMPLSPSGNVDAQWFRMPEFKRQSLAGRRPAHRVGSARNPAAGGRR